MMVFSSQDGNAFKDRGDQKSIYKHQNTSVHRAGENSACKMSRPLAFVIPTG